MGKSTKPTKWFQAVKKAFQSPSKERPSSPANTKADANEKLVSKHDFPPTTPPTLIPHPLPLFEIISHEVEAERLRGQPLPTPHTILDPTISPSSPDKNEEKQEAIAVPQTQQHDDEDSTLSEEEQAATKIQQRFIDPQAMGGLVRLQALVRGHLLRRLAATTLRTMEAIVRVQALVRGRRVRASDDGRAVSRARSRACRNSESLRSEDEATKPPAMYRPTQQLKRNAGRSCPSFLDHGGWAWLERWTLARPWGKNRQADDARDFIEIIPSSRKSAQFTTKEVDVNTKVKYYEDRISGLSSSSSSWPEKKDAPGPKEGDATRELEQPDLSPHEAPSSDALSLSQTNSPPYPNVTHCDSFSASNGVHLDAPSLKGSDDGHEKKARKGENRTGGSPQVASKKTPCRYMTPTESAKAKFRSSSNPKVRSAPETPEPPEPPALKRHSLGGPAVVESPKPTTRKSTSLQARRSASPKPGAAGVKEKPRSVDVSPARRASLGGAEAKRWRT